MQRYMEHFPAAGEIVIFDRSWYNRAGVEHVMGFCTPEQHQRFLELCPVVEKFVVDGGIRLLKIWLEVGQKEQERRFMARIDDPIRQWKLSPMDLESFKRWYEFSKARDMMLERTDTDDAPWYIVRTTTSGGRASTPSPTSWRRSPTSGSTRPRSSCHRVRTNGSTTTRRRSRAGASSPSNTDGWCQEVAMEVAYRQGAAGQDRRGGRSQGFGRVEGDACGRRGEARPAREVDQAVGLERRGDHGEGLDHHQPRRRERPDVGAGLPLSPFDLHRQRPGHQPGRGGLGEDA